MPQIILLGGNGYALEAGDPHIGPRGRRRRREGSDLVRMLVRA